MDILSALSRRINLSEIRRLLAYCIKEPERCEVDADTRGDVSRACQRPKQNHQSDKQIEMNGDKQVVMNIENVRSYST